MKKVLLFPIALFFSSIVSGQNVGIGTTTPNASAVLDITHTSKGLLIPRMATAAINLISNPAKGLMVYDSVQNVLMVNMGTAAAPNWQTIAANSGWALTGNAGTNAANNFVGTKDGVPLLFKVNNAKAGYIDDDEFSANTSFGFTALSKNTSGVLNVAIGYGALNNNTSGYSNTAIGYQSLYSDTSGIGNTANGVSSLASNTTGSDNTADGLNSLYSNTTGNYNTADGSNSLYSNTSGSYNTAIGETALFQTTNSQYNTAVGFDAGSSQDMGYNNTILGANSDVNADGLYNCIAIGQGVICNASSQAIIGNSSTDFIGGYANWTNISDGRYKKDVQENVKGLGFIMKLRPVTYHLDATGLSNKLNESRGKAMNVQQKKAITEKEQIVQTGFVAQEVEKAASETGYDFSGVYKPKNENDFYGLRYAEFVAPMVKAIQEQQQMIMAQQQKIETQQQMMDTLQQEIQMLKDKIK